MTQKKMVSLFFGLLLISQEAGATAVRVRDDYGPGGKAMVKAEGVLKAPPEAVWGHLIRFNHYADFMPRVLESFFISEEGVQALREGGTENANKLRKIAGPYKIPMPRNIGHVWEGLVFMVVDTPFPVENRWYVLRAIQDESRSSQKIYKRCWSLVTGNIDSANGCWHLTPGPHQGETTASYEDSINPGGKVPEWVARKGSHETIPAIFRSLEKQAMGARQE